MPSSALHSYFYAFFPSFFASLVPSLLILPCSDSLDSLIQKTEKLGQNVALDQGWILVITPSYKPHSFPVLPIPLSGPLFTLSFSSSVLHYNITPLPVSSLFLPSCPHTSLPPLTPSSLSSASSLIKDRLDNPATAGLADTRGKPLIVLMLKRLATEGNVYVSLPTISLSLSPPSLSCVAMLLKCTLLYLIRFD